MTLLFKLSDWLKRTLCTFVLVLEKPRSSWSVHEFNNCMVPEHEQASRKSKLTLALLQLEICQTLGTGRCFFQDNQWTMLHTLMERKDILAGCMLGTSQAANVFSPFIARHYSGWSIRPLHATIASCVLRSLNNIVEILYGIKARFNTDRETENRNS